jgi:methyltransferase (TIGR00027 family)
LTEHSEPLIRHISDTARWAAVYRARETERPDAVFRDPYARRLAGKRGEEIAAALTFHDQNSWAWVMRTYVFDQFIAEQLRQGTDMVVNLAAGLDARPYRMALPPSLRWIEVDLPAILEYKEEMLEDERPSCALQRVSLDLADAAARRELFASLDGQATRALVLTEGLAIYLTAEQVGGLAEDLARPRAFQRWLLDIASPGLLKMLQKNTGTQFDKSVPTLKFAPPDGPRFFVRHGWEPLEVRTPIRAAARHQRLSLVMGLLARMLPETAPRGGRRPWSGVCLLGKVGTAAAGGADGAH